MSGPCGTRFETQGLGRSPGCAGKTFRQFDDLMTTCDSQHTLRRQRSAAQDAAEALGPMPGADVDAPDEHLLANNRADTVSPSAPCLIPTLEEAAPVATPA